MYEQWFKLEGWKNKLSLICKGPSWQIGLPRLGNHQYPEIKYPIEFYHPKISLGLSIYTFVHFLFVFIQYHAVLQDSKVNSLSMISIFEKFCLLELFGDVIAVVFNGDFVYFNDFWYDI